MKITPLFKLIQVDPDHFDIVCEWSDVQVVVICMTLQDATRLKDFITMLTPDIAEVPAGKPA